jgi:hypothetical protein
VIFLIQQVLICLTVLTAIRGDLPSYVFLVTRPEQKTPKSNQYSQNESDFSRGSANPATITADTEIRRSQPCVIIFGARASEFFRSPQYTPDQAFFILMSLLQSLPTASAEPKGDDSPDDSDSDLSVPISPISLSMQQIRSAKVYHGFCSDMIVCVHG